MPSQVCGEAQSFNEAQSCKEGVALAVALLATLPLGAAMAAELAKSAAALPVVRTVAPAFFFGKAIPCLAKNYIHRKEPDNVLMGSCTPVVTTLKFTVANRFPALQRPIATKYFVGNFPLALAGLPRKFWRCGSQIRFQTMAWFLGPAGATGQLVHLAGFDSLKAAAKLDVKCRSSLQFCA